MNKRGVAGETAVRKFPPAPPKLFPAPAFPPLHRAGVEGLLCAGGDLSPERLLAAYSRGIFPWYSEGVPILWWSPDPRLVLPLKHMRIPRSLPRDLRRAGFACTINAAFGRVIEACAATPRPGQNGTWLLPEMVAAYKKLHAMGYAVSAECWQGPELVGGIYGVALGRAFFGESMFYARPNASKAALLHLAYFLRRRGTILFDCQQTTAHMLRFGAVEISRREFARLLRLAVRRIRGLPARSPLRGRGYCRLTRHYSS